jgi:hypothetical protein
VVAAWHRDSPFRLDVESAVPHTVARVLALVKAHADRAGAQRGARWRTSAWEARGRLGRRSWAMSAWVPAAAEPH